jgi:hypothetical protein
MVFGAEVFNVSTSVWVTGCSVGSVAVVWRFVDGCGCSVCGMGVAWVVGWAVVGTWSSATWHEPSAGGSFLSLFLGGAFVGVLLSSQMVGANVGSQWP